MAAISVDLDRSWGVDGGSVYIQASITGSNGTIPWAGARCRMCML